MILFLSKYPRTSSENADGMLRRVTQVDNLLNTYDRVYLYFELKRCWRPSKCREMNRVDIRVNIIWFFFYLKYFWFARNIYLHSIHAVRRCFPILLFSKNFILDIHGVVPEEAKFREENFLRILFYSVLELLIIKKVSCLIGVTDKMVTHMINKYKISTVNSIILPMSMIGSFYQDRVNGKDIDIIYAGGIVKWQNIDKLARLCNKYLDLNVKLFINGYQKVADMFVKKGDLALVDHSELLPYLFRAKTGFIVRDQHILNSVACPTKLIEYIQCGIVPIVDFEDLGDFKNMGYEYIKYDEILENGLPEYDSILKKANHNYLVLEQLVQIIENGENNLREYIRTNNT